MAVGVLHHLDDEMVESALDLAHGLLEPGGRFVSIDPTLTDDQHPIARLLVKSDRGQHVRSPGEMAALVGSRLPGAAIWTRDDLLRPPYTHVVVRAVKQ
jgi:hypothetical protein